MEKALIMKKTFNSDIDEINKNIKEVEKMLNESMNFYEDDSFDEPEMDGDSEIETTPEIEGEPEIDDDVELEKEKSDSFVDTIRKEALNGLSALCDEPEDGEYQILKKIFQMCDKNLEKKDEVNESKRLFGILKENKKVLFETYVEDSKNFAKIKKALVSEAISKGIDPSRIRLVSEKKLIR
jgi:hypothetical protein